MRARVLEVDLHSRVRLLFDAGELLVRAAEDTRVTPGNEAGVEFDVRETLVMGRTAFPALNKVYSVQNVGDNIHMCGVVDGVDPDGMVYFRLGPDSLTMIESLPGAFTENQWLRVQIGEELVCAYLRVR